jgi:hypothetical protein
MAKYRVRKTLVVECSIDVIVEAGSADEADDAACITPSNVGVDYRDAGWKAKVEVIPPKHVEIVSRKAKTTWIDTASGREPKPKKISQAA